MGRTKFDEKTGTNSRVRSVSNCSGTGSGDEMSGPFRCYDYKQTSGLKSAQGCAWTSKGKANANKSANNKDSFGAWGNTFKNEASFKQMHWC